MQYILVFVASLFPYFASFLTAAVARVAVALGFGTVAYTGFNYLFDAVLSRLNSSVSDLPVTVAQFLVMSGLPDAFNIYFGAISAAFILRGISPSGQVRRVVWGKAGG